MNIPDLGYSTGRSYLLGGGLLGVDLLGGWYLDDDVTFNRTWRAAVRTDPATLGSSLSFRTSHDEGGTWTAWSALVAGPDADTWRLENLDLDPSADRVLFEITSNTGAPTTANTVTLTVQSVEATEYTNAGATAAPLVPDQTTFIKWAYREYGFHTLSPVALPSATPTPQSISEPFVDWRTYYPVWYKMPPLAAQYTKTLYYPPAPPPEPPPPRPRPRCIPLMPHVDPIGCGEYRFGIVDRDGAPLGELTGISSYLWDRRLDDVSQAAISLAMSDARPECNDLISRVRTWRHDLVVFRNGETVWRGPLVEVDLGPSDANFIAMDVLAWMEKRIVHVRRDYTDDPGTDPVEIAQDLIADALELDDPGFQQFIFPLLSDLKIKRVYEPNSQYVIGALRDLAAGSLDFTVVNRRIYLGPEDTFGHLGRWGDKYFPDGYRVVESGLDASGYVTVVGSEVIGTAEGLPSNNAYYGVLERLVTDSTIVDEDSANELADRFASSSDIPPLIIRMEEGTLLSPDTPVGINQLIPGVTVDFYGSYTARPVTQRLRLQRVSVTDEGGEDAGEKIRLVFAPVGGIDVTAQVF